MPTNLKTKAVEKSAFVIHAAFTNENGVAMIPKTITWTLLDKGTGNVVNNRDGVSVAAPAASVDILLSGDDLAMVNSTAPSEIREVIIEATYDGSLGNDIPVKDSVDFALLNIAHIT